MDGDLGLTSSEPFEYQVSTKVLNEVLEIVLGKNQLSVDVPYSDLVRINFPIRWDSTNLDNFIPDLTDYIGFDVPLSMRFKNVGAPRFIFNREEANILFNMEVEVWDEHYENYILTIKYHEVHVDFDMWLEGMNLTCNWNTIKMKNAEVTSPVVKNLERVHANQKVTQFFNYAFDIIIPWINEEKPYAVAIIPLPSEIDDMLYIRDLKMAIRQNYFAFTLDPVFIMKATQE